MESGADAAESKSLDGALASGVLSGLVGATVLGLAVFDRELRYTWINEALAKLNGKPVDAHLGRAVRDVIPMIAGRLEPVLRGVLESGEPLLGLKMIGAERHVIWDVVPIRAGGATSPTHVAAVVVEVTDLVTAQNALAERLRLSNVASALSARFLHLSVENASEGFLSALRDVAEPLDLDRAHICLFAPSRGTYSRMHHWTREGVASNVLRDVEVPVERFSWLMRRLLASETVAIDTPAELPPEATAIREALVRDGTRSILLLPLVSGGAVLGFVAFESVRTARAWKPELVSSLRLVAEIFASALDHDRKERLLRERLRFEETLSSVAARFGSTTTSSIDEVIDWALETVSRALGLTRANVLFLDRSTHRFEPIHEWRAEGVLPFAPAMTGLPIEQFGWPLREIFRGESVLVRRDRVPADAQIAMDVLERAGIRSSVNLPLRVGGEVVGFLSFQAVGVDTQVDDTMLHRSRVVGELVANAIAKQRAAVSLEASESRFRSVIQSALDGVIVAREDGSVLEWTERASALFGITRDRAISRSLFDVLPFIRERDELSSGLAAFVDDRARARLDGRLEMERGSEGHGYQAIELSISSLDTSAPRTFAIFARDISDRRRIERERQKAFDEILRLKTELQRERDYLREEIRSDPQHGGILGESPALRRAIEAVDAVAATTATVLLRGESGVGKELFARALHERSPRADAPLVKVNCASIPESLFESEFFGHVKGSFTGAYKDRTGRFELADNGTLFLDEVGEIPLDLQAKLLRVLQESELERVGDDKTRKVDVRIVAATNRDLEADVLAGNFRRDLYYRLSVFPIDVPPLRQRPEDIVLLAEHFLAAFAKSSGRHGLTLDADAREVLLRYDWPGNVRELSHVIERAVILSRTPPLRLDLALRVAPTKKEPTPPGPASTREPVLTAKEMEAAERGNLLRALERAAGRVAGPGGAAEMLGMRPSTLRDRLRSLGIKRD